MIDYGVELSSGDEVKCEHCYKTFVVRKTFFTSAVLWRHLNPLACPHCGELFKYRDKIVFDFKVKED